MITRITEGKEFKCLGTILTEDNDIATEIKQSRIMANEMLQIFERRILRMIYGAINDNGTWKTSYNNELYTVYDEPDIVKLVKTGRLRWLEHLC